MDTKIFHPKIFTFILLIFAFYDGVWDPVDAQLPLMPSGGRRSSSNSRASEDLLHLQSRVRPGSGPSQLSGPPSVSACSQDCSEERLRPVCGTDGRTYESRCEITRAKCEGHSVELLHNGRCAEMTRCRGQRAQAQARSRDSSVDTFVPECQENGSYVQVQCYSRSGYCWCVDESGKLISGSMVQNNKPNCGVQGSRRLNRRRTSSKGPRQLKVCSNGDRSTFNRNLIEIFRSEYDRVKPLTTTVPPQLAGEDPLLDTEQKRVVQWKFTQLDDDKDNSLKRLEIRDLRRMVKKIVRPKPCAKSFTKYCDLDHNKKISRSEWSACLGVDINISFRLFMSLNSDEQTEEADMEASNHHQHHLAPHFNQHNEESEDADEDVFHDAEGTATEAGLAAPAGQMALIGQDAGATSNGNGASGLAWGKHISTLKGDERVSDAGIESREEDFSDCHSARRSATEAHHAAPTGGHYIPECTPDGGYQPAQCHQNTGFCWCVHHKSGKPIRGTTATHGDKPDCEAAKKSAKSFKECSLKKKQRFTEEYLEFIKQEMLVATKNKTQGIGPTSQVTSYEEIARWKMIVLDSNKNQILDRREWKIFRKDWKVFRKANRRRKKLRKCWRNYLRFCDANADHRITLQEWLTCTSFNVGTAPGALPQASGNTGIAAVKTKPVLDKNLSSPRRRGPNPFDTILKSD